MVNFLAVVAACWGVLMAVSPVLQIARMRQRGSSDDVSIGYLAVLVPGFVLWLGYGLASSNLALVVPNAVAATVGLVTLAVALRLR